MDGKATVFNPVFSARVKQLFTAFSRLATPSVAVQDGLCTCITWRHGSWSPAPLIAAVGRRVGSPQAPLESLVTFSNRNRALLCKIADFLFKASSARCLEGCTCVVCGGVGVWSTVCGGHVSLPHWPEREKLELVG